MRPWPRSPCATIWTIPVPTLILLVCADQAAGGHEPQALVPTESYRGPQPRECAVYGPYAAGSELNPSFTTIFDIPISTPPFYEDGS